MKVVILNDFTAINEAFRKNEFLGRPKNIVFNVLMELQGFRYLYNRKLFDLFFH
jgi:hypothetical protein